MVSGARQNSELAKTYVEQLTPIVETYNQLKRQAKYDDMSDLGYTVAHSLISRATAAIDRATGRDSSYSRRVQEIMARNTHDFEKLSMIIGVVDSLIIDLKAGYPVSAAEMIRGEVFGDYLEMASYLEQEGYKDAAAVIAGSTLEAHLRQLCGRSAIPIEVTTPKGTQPKKAELLNADLVNGNVISKLDQKNVTAWLDLRNKEAHAETPEVLTWAAAVRQLYHDAQTRLDEHPAPNATARTQQYLSLHARACALGQPYAQAPAHPCAVLAKRLLRHQDELFQFVLIPDLPPDNNLAERSIRPLVVLRKISGGSRSAAGTDTRVMLASLFGTWQARHLNPLTECLRALQSPQVACSPAPP